MFVSTTSIRPFIQNENPDNTGFKKPGASKSGGLSLRTPFKDRSVNSVSPASKYNSKLQMQKKMVNPVKNVKSTSTKSEQTGETDDIYKSDYASFQEVVDGFGDIFPFKRLDVEKFLRDRVSGNSSPLYMSDEEFDEPILLPGPNFDMRCYDLPSPVDLYDVPLPIFNF